jgi:hypothetical protein
MGKAAKICFLGELLIRTHPKGVFHPKYFIPYLFNDITDSHRQQLDSRSSASGI